MGHRRDVFDRFYIYTSRLERRDCTLPSTAWTIHPNINVLDPKLFRLVCGLLGSTLASKRCALPASLEAGSAGTGPAQRVSFGVGYSDGGVVECCLDIDDARRNITSNFLFFTFCHKESPCKLKNKNVSNKTTVNL